MESAGDIKFVFAMSKGFSPFNDLSCYVFIIAVKLAFLRIKRL